MMTIHFNADLRPVVGDRVGMLHWVMDPETSGFIIGYDLSVNQVLIWNFDVGDILSDDGVVLTCFLARKAPRRVVE
jgi:hypothetical protein